MNRVNVVICLSLISGMSFGLVSDGWAQTQSLLSITPKIGWFQPLNSFRDVAPAEGEENPETTRLRHSPAIGITVDLNLPIPIFDLRGGLLYTVGSKLGVSRSTGEVSCGVDCYRTLYRLDPIADASLLALSADLVLRAPRIVWVQPSLYIGAGIERYDFDQPALAGPFATAFAEDETRRAMHFGLGLDFEVGRWKLASEVTNFMSSIQVPRVGQLQDLPTSMPVRELQNNLTITLGLRISLY